MANEYELYKLIEQQQQQINSLAQNQSQGNAYLWQAHGAAATSRANAAIEQGLQTYPMALTPGERKAVGAMVSNRMSADPQLAAKIMSGDVSDIAKITEQAAAEIRPRKNSPGRPVEDDWDTAAESFAKDAYRR